VPGDQGDARGVTGRAGREREDGLHDAERREEAQDRRGGDIGLL